MKKNISRNKISCNNYLFALILTVYSLSTSTYCNAQNQSDVSTSDIDYFWQAFDSIQQIKGHNNQVQIIQRLYIDKGSNGLKAFMKLRNFDALDLVNSINKHPKFWKSIRSNTYLVKDKQDTINKYVKSFKNLYPNFREAKIYFTITAIRSGGTTKDSLVLVGTEIATGNTKTDVSEFNDKRLKTFFETQKEDNILPFTIHEYVHTQQKTEGKTLLGQSIYEGACDFITELLLKNSLQHAYIKYGKLNEELLKEKFKKEMYLNDYSNWLYNGSTAETVGDLGYFMRYTICKSYYKNASDKTKAITEIVELDYSDLKALKAFLKASCYYDI